MNEIFAYAIVTFFGLFCKNFVASPCLVDVPFDL